MVGRKPFDTVDSVSLYFHDVWRIMKLRSERGGFERNTFA